MMQTALQNDTSKITFIRRIGILIYEVFLLVALLFAMAIPPTIVFNITAENPLYDILVQGMGVYLIAVGFFYFGWSWTRAGQTLALKTWKTKLISQNGGRVTWKQSLIRYAVAIISLMVGGIGFLWPLFNKENATWHGIASSTKLVKTDT